MQKETLTRQYTLLTSELEINLPSCQYRIVLFNNTALANAIGNYFSERRPEREYSLVLDALLYSLQEPPELGNVEQIHELMKKIDPESYNSISLEEFIEVFAFNGEIIKKDLDYSCFGRVLPRF